MRKAAMASGGTGAAARMSGAADESRRIDRTSGRRDGTRAGRYLVRE
jgi:hypothetical protein